MFWQHFSSFLSVSQSVSQYSVVYANQSAIKLSLSSVISAACVVVSMILMVNALNMAEKEQQVVVYQFVIFISFCTHYLLKRNRPLWFNFVLMVR